MSTEKLNTDAEYNQAEEAVVALSHAFGLSEADVVELINNGLALHYKTYKLPEKANDMMNELKATFDCL